MMKNKKKKTHIETSRQQQKLLSACGFVKQFKNLDFNLEIEILIYLNKCMHITKIQNFKFFYKI